MRDLSLNLVSNKLSPSYQVFLCNIVLGTKERILISILHKDRCDKEMLSNYLKYCLKSVMELELTITKVPRIRDCSSPTEILVSILKLMSEEVKNGMNID